MSESETQEVVSDPLVPIKEAFIASMEASMSEDEVKMAMIQAGATFKSVTRIYNQLMVDAGLVMSREDRDAFVKQAVSTFEISTESGFDDAVNLLLEKIPNSTDRSAAALLRSYSKKNGVEIFAKPKATGGTRNPFVDLFFDGLVENPSMTEEQLEEILNSLDEKHQVNPRRWLSSHNKFRKVVNRVAEKLSA